MKVRALSTVLALSIALPLAIAERPACAQVSDADRNAARDLYNEGWQLQQSGRYADALDRYQRSLSVFPAPTTAFRLAQCKAALGKLVEAAEGYRAIVNAPLPAGSPPAFATAKNDASTELAKLEPRIPKIQINVQPAGLQGLVVQVDNVNMPTALVGVPRPIDPGSHTIVASAPGYAQSQTQVDVRERQSPMPQVTLTLQPGGGVAYQPNGGGTTYQNGSTYPNGGGYPPNGGYTGNSGYSPYNTWVPPRRREEGPRNAFMIGVDAALSVPFGTPLGTDLTSLLNVGGGGGVDVGLRLARVLYLGALAQLTGFNNSSNLKGGTGISFALDAVLGLMSNPEGVGIYGELGAGFRYFSVNNPVGNAFSMTTLDVIIGLGFQVKAGSFRVIPKIDFYLGPNNTSDGGAHGFFTLGIAGFWEMPFGPKRAPAAQAVPATPATTTTPAE